MIFPSTLELLGGMLLAVIVIVAILIAYGRREQRNRDIPRH
jgi:hypothetical protein